MFGKRQALARNSDDLAGMEEAMAADFRDHAARIRSMADGRKPDMKARLRIIAQTLDDRGSALLKRTGS